MDLPVLDVLPVAGAAAAQLALDGGVSASCPPHRSAFPLPRTASGVGVGVVLLVVVVALCVATTVLGALLPASFPVDIASGAAIALQGLWFYQTAFTLYGPSLPAGCRRDADGHIDCHTHAAQERAEQLANFQLFGLVFLVCAYALGCFAVAAARHGHPDLATMHAKHVAAMEAQLAGAGAGEGDRFVGSALPLEDTAI
jgi:hypothetical protein